MPSDTQVDLFILHSAADADWVEDWLTPRLTDAGITTATHEDFRSGHTVALDYELAVAQSRYVAFVLTPEGLDDRWAAFAASLALHRDPANLTERLLPLILRPCPTLPAALRDLTSADFTANNPEATIAKLIAILSGQEDVYSHSSTSSMQYTEAMANYDKAIELNPADAVAHNNRGLEFYGLKQYTKAITSYDKATELNPGYPLPYYNRGIALYDLARYAEAIASYDKAIELDPAYAAAYTNRGVALRALEQQTEAIELDTAYQAAHHNRDNTYWHRGLHYAQAAKPMQVIERIKQHPLIVSISLLTAILVAAFAIYSDSGLREKYPLFPPATSTPTSLAFRPSSDDETLIVIAEFVHREGVDDTDPAGEIAIAIRDAAKALDFATLRVEVEPTQIGRLGREKAEALGRRYDAAIVIWGEVSTVAVTTNFLNLSEPELPAADVTIRETERTQSRQELEGIPVFSEYVTLNLPGQLTFLAFFAVGSSYYQAKDFATAHVAFAQSVASLPDDAELEGRAIASFSLAFTEQVAGDYKEAVASYDEAIELDPAYAAAYNNRGAAFSVLERHAEAIASYGKAIELNPAFAVAYGNRGIALSLLERHAEAIASYDKVIELDPAHVAAYNNRGVSLSELKRHEEAIASYDKVIELNPAYAAAYNNRGTALRALERHEEAIVSYDKAIELNPVFAEAYTNRGLALSESKQFTKAIDDFDKTIELRSAFPLARYSRGITYWNWGIEYAQQGDFAQAAELMQVRVDYEQEIGHSDAEKDVALVEEYRQRAAAGE